MCRIRKLNAKEECKAYIWQVIKSLWHVVMAECKDRRQKEKAEGKYRRQSQKEKSGMQRQKAKAEAKA